MKRRIQNSNFWNNFDGPISRKIIHTDDKETSYLMRLYDKVLINQGLLKNTG